MPNSIPTWTPPPWVDPDQKPLRNSTHHLPIHYDDLHPDNLHPDGEMNQTRKNGDVDDPDPP